MNPAKLFKDIGASVARFLAVPQKVATLTAARLSQTMTNVASNRGRKRHGTATAVPNGVLIRAYTYKPHFGAGWRLELQRIARSVMREAANGGGSSSFSAGPAGSPVASGGGSGGGSQGRDSAGKFKKKG